MADPRFIRKLFDVCRSRGVIVAPFLLAIVTSCHTPRPESGVRPHLLSSGVNNFFATNFPLATSVADIAGYNDEQRLPVNGTYDYGAIVRLYVAPQTPTPTQLGSAAGAIVALMEVEGGNGHYLPDYAKLGISNDVGPTLYCVLLRSGNPPGSYDGFVTPVKPDGTCTAIDNTYMLPNEADTSEPDAPYVARFVEDASGSPAIGVGCPNGTSTPLTFVFCHLGRGVGMGKHSRDDEQDLAIPAPGSIPPVSRSTIRGKISPVIGATGFGPTPVQVATISLSADPNPHTRSTYKTWGLAKGDNGVWISVDTQGNWWAQFVPVGTALTTQTKFQITRTAHSSGPAVPVAARWLWNDNDEDVWVACDAGCCTITGFTGA